MCFSATASFGAGVVLTVIGVATLKKTHHPSQWLFACIPFFFGVQQMAEGLLWLSIPNPQYAGIQKPATFVFLFFAQVLWPLWIPIAVLLLEKNETNKQIQRVLVGAGVMVGSYLAYSLLRFHVEAKITGHHIQYVQDYSVSLRYYSYALYGLATILPPFFSHIRGMKMLGISVLVSYLITALFYDHYVLSVWCFFSSLISLSIYTILKGMADQEGTFNFGRPVPG